VHNRRLAPILRRSWVILVIGAVIGGWGAYFFASRSTPSYASDVSLLTGPINDTSTNLQDSGSIARTYAELATTAPVLLDAAKKAHINAPLKQLQNDVTATSNDVTRIVTVRVLRPNRTEAAQLAAAIGDDLIKLSAPTGQTPIEAFMASSAVARLSQSDQNAIQQAAATAFGDASAGRLTVVDPAREPTSAAGPKVVLITLLGIVAGIVLAAILVFIREVSSEAIDSEDEIAGEVGVPVLGAVHMGGGPLHRQVRAVMPGDRSRFASECNVIASKLGVVGDGEVRSVLIAGSDRGVGAGVFAASLASVLTERGLRLLVVDADDVDGEATSLFGLGGVPGYGDVIRSMSVSEDDEPQLGEFVVDVAPRLSVLASGTQSPGPINRANARRLLDHLVDDVDVVIVSSAAMGRGGEPLVLASVCDATVLVVRRRHSTRDSVARAVEDLRRAGARGLGAVFAHRPALARGTPYGGSQHEAHGSAGAAGTASAQTRR
jgi:capsular polysaccharide biosynthesis protein